MTGQTIILGERSGWYSAKDKAYYAESETSLNNGKRVSPKGTPVVWVEDGVKLHHKTGKLRTPKMMHGRVEKHHGKSLVVMEKVAGTKQKSEFKPEFVMLTMPWVTALQQMKSAQAWDLSVRILIEHLRLGFPNEIALMGKVTKGVPRATKAWVIDRLEKCGLVKIVRNGNGKAFRLQLLSIKRTPLKKRK